MNVWPWGTSNWRGNWDSVAEGNLSGAPEFGFWRSRYICTVRYFQEGQDANCQARPAVMKQACSVVPSLLRFPEAPHGLGYRKISSGYERFRPGCFSHLKSSPASWKPLMDSEVKLAFGFQHLAYFAGSELDCKYPNLKIYSTEKDSMTWTARSETAFWLLIY